MEYGAKGKEQIGEGDATVRTRSFQTFQQPALSPVEGFNRFAPFKTFQTNNGFLKAADDSPRSRVPMRQKKTFGDLTEGRSVESGENLERIVLKKKKG